ncbi:phosphoenolpyruvate synthase [Dissulfurirhabdus thermomarina]|uniref:Phosphoenolpyruvate synthase n=1 Tax=Dissulfurirhabdus thermomarina TaxID=1765737 RepID=A0A6N9TLR3_DISTH|nr:phosphoenolpyruvate synthase [Dissulfurirhabdus thermomarina]NDY42221.1 phosphoenolpyruvate synthase [Dissulfurirhabdus thermomarina]NMX24114.1 phosphoenolpyruvate synthase [Dissulfurirhabdus thermomarina]
MSRKPFILWFEEIGIKDVPLVGGKNASLGEMYRHLTSKGVQVPNGFAITAEAYIHLLKDAGIEGAIRKALEGLDTHNMKNLQARGKKVRDIILKAPFPEDLEKEIVAAYRRMEKIYGPDVDVAVRSSATAEDLPDASFAGQQETYLNIRGPEMLLDACHRCFASLFTDRAISYRHDKGFGHFDVYLSIAVQKMVRSDSASSGVMFTMDTESGFDKVVYITGAWGLGENVVQGAVNPDEFYVFKPTLETGHRPVVSKRLGLKQKKMVYTKNPRRPVTNKVTTQAERNRFVLSDDELITLAKWACIIERHYGKAMDIEWAKDGDGKKVGTGGLFIVQARPETVHSQRDTSFYETYVLKESGKVLATGKAVGSKIGQGRANVIKSVSDISKFKKGEVLVTDMTDPDWEPIMKVASAIVTNRGGRTCHAAIVSRELGIPCVVGTENGTEAIRHGQKVTVSCAEGEEGRVYEGLLKFEVQRLDLREVPKTRTKIMMNVGIPEQAFSQGQIPNDGVGLARLEFIINSHIGIHPLALLDFKNLKRKARNDAAVREVVQAIEERTLAYKDKSAFFVDTLAQGVARIAAGFWPNDVIVRLSDFKSNEYANLIGGALYEPEEHNPMIGWRGASRYYAPAFEPAFALECQALRKVRDEMGLTNVKVMIPFCRTVEEGKKVIGVMKKHGLVQGDNGLEVYVMCEIPSNVVLADQFAEVFDGFSIGSNDLTQLTLGLDRDSELVAHIYDERNEAVKRLVRQVIDTAKKKRRKIGICGQAPSDFPDFAAFLVECGIDSMSLTPDTAVRTRLMVAEKERELAGGKKGCKPGAKRGGCRRRK